MAITNVLSTRSFLLLALTLSPLSAAQDAVQGEAPVKLLSSDESFHFELLLPIGESIFSGGDVGPLLSAAKDIEPGNFSSFSSVFYDLANRTKAQAEDPALAYDPVNVRDTWFAAATYFRRADFYLHGNWDDPRINAYWDEQIAAFDKGMAALPVPGKRLRLPADGFEVEAIWFSATDDCKSKRPTLILGNGYDGSQEDLYHTVVVPALARGWNAITYEGPGHPTVRRRQNIGFIPDWERAVTPVVDYLLEEQAEAVDKDRLVLLGYSFGGYLAARAAAFEPRLSAVVLDGGIWDTYTSFTSRYPPAALKLLESGNKTAFDEVVAAIRGSPKSTSQIRWGIDQGLWSFKQKSAYDWLQACKKYTIKDVFHKIKVPVYVADAQFEDFFTGQASLVKKALGDKATYHQFNATAGYHCQVGSLQELNREVFAWLHKMLG